MTAPQLSGQPSDAEQLVRKLFAVKQSFNLPEGELEFQVGYDDSTRGKFVELRDQLRALGYRPEMTGKKGECVLIIRKLETKPKTPPQLPVYLALFTMGGLVVAAINEAVVSQQLVPSLQNYATFLEFAVTVAVLLGAHELGQRYMARRRDAGHASSYLIPGLPFIPPFLPSLGILASQREPALNRDNLFDTVVAGPLAVLVLAVIFYSMGDVTAVQSTVPFQNTALANTTVSIYPNAIQLAIDSLLSRTPPAGYVFISPIADGATVGFILLFFAFLPLASYDGGFLVNIAWGQRAARTAGYLSILGLLVLDTPTYWAVAIIGLIMVGRPYQLKLLDEVSGLSTSRHWILVATIVLAFMCLPVPHNFAALRLP
jgi:membrane-associated protease RseP (regulator of RpoE activity)